MLIVDIKEKLINV